MFEVFTTNLIACMAELLEETSRHGASYFGGALRLSVCGALSEEAAPHPFSTLKPDPAKRVIEDMQLLKVELGHPRFPMVSHVGDELANLINPFLTGRSNRLWQPNEAAIHRYHSTGQGLGAHRDFSSDVLIIAVFTLFGSGTFELLHEDGSLNQAWDCQPGGLCLMRAPGLTGQDDRPLHRALPPAIGLREAVIYRQVNPKLASN
jgi:hypothetical protein